MEIIDITMEKIRAQKMIKQSYKKWFVELTLGDMLLGIYVVVVDLFRYLRKRKTTTSLLLLAGPIL